MIYTCIIATKIFDTSNHLRKFYANDIGKALPSCIYPIKYINVPLLPYDSLLDNTVLYIFILSILIGFLFL